EDQGGQRRLVPGGGGGAGGVNRGGTARGATAGHGRSAGVVSAPAACHMQGNRPCATPSITPRWRSNAARITGRYAATSRGFGSAVGCQRTRAAAASASEPYSPRPTRAH